MRVVQWGTGNIGAWALRRVVEHPDLELAGVYVSSAEKVGLDAGRLCGVADTGIRATGDVEEILALRADCVLYMPRLPDLDDLCRLLESGSNVVSTCGGFHHPDGLDPATRGRVEAACMQGGTSLHSTGSSPGFVTEALPLVLASIERRLDGLTISEYADLSRRDSPGLLFEIMGFGRPPAAFDERRLTHGEASFGPSLRLVADALGIPLDAVEATGDLAVTPRPVTIAAGTLEAGTVAAQRMTVTGVRGGRPVLRFAATWYCAADLAPAWDLRPTGWHIALDGDAPLDIDLRFPADRLAEVTPGYTANRAVNAVAAVCAAAPGIRSTLDLPHLVSNLA